MADKCEDEELRAGINQARKKPRNFALVAKGSSAVKLIVSKKPIKASDVQKAKTEAKGNIVVEGVVQGEGTELVFQTVGEEPSIKVLTIKELINEQTGLTLKARFQMVTELPKVLEDDDEVPEAPPMPPGPTSEVPPEAPPTKPTAADEDLLMMLISAMGKLGPRIQEAIKKFPDKREELVGGVGNFQKQVKAKDAAGAKASLLAVSELVKGLIGDAPPPPKEEKPAANPKAAQWEKEWAALEPEYLAALKTATDDLAGKMRAVHAYATEQAEATQYDKALTALARLRPLIEQAGKAQPESVSGDEGEFQALFEKIEPRYLEILKQNPDNAGELRSTMDFANGKADEGNYESAVSSLNKLSRLLDETEEMLREQAIEAQIDEEDEGRGVVAFRKALLTWDAARSAAVSELRSLQAVVIGKYPDADVDRLSEIFDTVDESLHDALIDCINAEDAEDRKYYSAIALEAVREFEEKIDDNDLIQGVDRNPFDENLELGKRLKSALSQVATFLR
ncbi:MAG: hypothetical protein SFU86_02665 [Pirellulaceae bacterium]|nr:hypothetical protein [Pirellulaceae bacterium]